MSIEKSKAKSISNTKTRKQEERPSDTMMPPPSTSLTMRQALTVNAEMTFSSRIPPQESYCVRVIHGYQEGTLAPTTAATTSPSSKHSISASSSSEITPDTSQKRQREQQPQQVSTNLMRTVTHSGQQEGSFQAPLNSPRRHHHHHPLHNARKQQQQQVAEQERRSPYSKISKAKSYRVVKPSATKSRQQTSSTDKTTRMSLKPWSYSSFSSPSAPFMSRQADSSITSSSQVVSRRKKQQKLPQSRSSPTTKSIIALSQQKRMVTFGTVQVREYAICLGNHPLASSDGPSLSLDWMYCTKGTLQLDQYEQSRKQQQQRRRRRLGHENHPSKSTTSTVPPPLPPATSTTTRITPIPGKIRQAIILYHTDCTHQEIVENIRQGRIVKRQRMATELATMPYRRNKHLRLEYSSSKRRN